MIHYVCEIAVVLIHKFLFSQTACADGVIRVHKLDDASSKSFKYESDIFVTFSKIMHAVFLSSSFFFFFLSLSPSFRFLRINLPPGGPPTAVAFADNATSIVVATHNLSGCSLYMYGEEKAISTNEGKQQSKLPGPEIKWEHHKVHDKRAILTLFGASATYGTADGSTIIASCSEGIIPIFFV